MAGLNALKQKYFPKGYRRFATNTVNKLIHRTSMKDFIRAYERLEIPAGSVICVHGALSGFGYIPDGPTMPMLALQKAIKDCTLMMPSFPISSTTIKYVANDPVFDRATTMSASGLLSEMFRQMPGTVRGWHPTHACVALGPRAAELIEGTETARTPFGDDSTYGRFSKLPDAVMVLLHTNSTSYVHRLQEVVDWPHLFVPELGRARTVAPDGSIQTFEVAMHRPILPLYVVMEGQSAGSVEYVWMPDYVVQFPSAQREHIRSKVESEKAKEYLEARQRHFLNSGVLKTARCGEGEVMLVKIRPWTEQVAADMRKSFENFPHAYELAVLEEAHRNGMLTQ